jgi:amino acid adenylation domain-containing protein
VNVKTQNIEDVYELSPLQQGMLFHSLRAPDSGMYFHQVAYSLQGAVDVQAFGQAWQRVVDRHPVLRTSFHWENLDKPLQVVHRKVKLPLEQLDWRGLPPAEQEAKLEAYLQENRQRGFALTQAPLLRLALIRLGEEEYKYIWSHHHILWDGWSGPLVIKEFLAFYEAIRKGQNLRLKPPRPFRDYILWLQKQDLAKAEAFWRKTLQGITAPTPLVIDRLGGVRSDQPERAEEQRVQLSPELSAGLQALARRQQVTLNTVMQAAWSLLLSRYSGQESVVFGTSVSGRPASLAGVEQMVGLFINTLPVRVDVHAEETLAAWLKQLQAQQAEMRQYEFSPLVQVHGWSEVPRGVPLFENMLVFENFPTDASVRQRVGGLGMRPVRQTVQKADYPLALVVMPAQQILLKVVYAGNRFDGAAVSRMLEHFQTVLEKMVANPDLRVEDVSLLKEAERELVLVDFNQAATAYPQNRCVYQLVEEQARQRPDAIALTFQGQTLTYGELDRRANQLAHYLRGLGVGLEDKVGLFLDRSLEMIVALLGVMKAGAAYVPLDIAQPAERLAFILGDTQVKAVLTQEALRAQCSPNTERADYSIICLDSDWPAIDHQRDDSPAGGAGPDSLAYLIYTSGSTGQPKGVLVEQRGFTNVICAHIKALDIGPETRALQFVALQFDAAQGEIFRVLAAGAILSLAPADALIPGPPLIGLLRDQHITLASIPPSVLLATQSKEELPALRAIVVGGESCPPQAAVRWGRGRRLFSGYGPTETTVGSTYVINWDVSRPPPLGKPLANTQVYVLDRRMQPVPVGVPGEVYIGGTGLARGYLNQPELTASCFLADPFSQQPGARLYKTGDQAYWQPDGTLEFLGRVDEQVKIRGFRVELGEVEAALGKHPNVSESVVLAREDTPGSKRLVAYVAARQEPAPSINDLREFLKTTLPESMLPSVFVFLPSLPKMLNGKVDRKALPVPDQQRPDMEEAFVAPRTPLEEMVAAIVADVLKLERVGVYDNFFELGGHSLLATQLVSRLRSTFEVEVSLKTFFQNPTVIGVAEGIEKARRQKAHKEQAPPLVRVSRDQALPLSFAQQRLWFFEQLEPGNLFYNLPNAIRLSGALEVGALERSFQEVVRRHEVLRTSFGNRDGQPYQVIAPVGMVTLPVIDISGLPDSERATQAKELATQETKKAFDLARGPLVRASLVKLGPEEHVLLMTMHHIISDGWSMGGIFFRELAMLYRAFSAGQPSPLPELPIQYADFAVWQRNWLRGDVLKQQLDYWRQQLADVPPLDLPTDRPRPEEQRFHGAHQSIKLPAELSAKLQALGRQEGATLFMTLLAAFQTLLSQYSGQDDIAVGTPIAGRNRSELEGLIGFFVNTLVMRTDLSGDPTFKQLLGRVREVCLGAYDHQDVPFEKLVEELQPNRDMSRSPLFQVLFVLQNAPRGQMKLGNLTLSPQEADRSIIAKFDITLSVTEFPQGLGVVVKYNTDLFETASMTRLLDHFRTLVEEVVADPERPLSAITLLSEAERRQVLVDWNQTAADYPRDQCAYQLFEQRAAEQPDAVALTFQGREMTFGELNRRANQLARYLQALGVGPESRVGLSVDRSMEMVLGLIGIHKAGAGYVPLDPGYPADRLTYMFQDSQINALLTQDRLWPGLPPVPVAVVSLDGDWPAIARYSDANPAGGAGPENLAYIIYTSGSSGLPKGVLVEHRGLTNVVMVHIHTFGVRPGHKVLQFVSLNFDAAQAEIWRALVGGATLCLGSSEELLPGQPLMDVLKNQRITMAALLPSVLSNLPLDQDLPGLRMLVSGGEVLPAEMATYWGRGRRLFHTYGPTETSICAAIAADWDVHKPPPLGRPVANTRVYVLDKRMQPVPVGVPGELYIGGVGVSRGYNHQPDLTAGRFIPNPFSETPGARFYKTGDKVRWLPDGNLQFLGRIDEQVKIRGFRIELGEIEAVLGQHPEVLQGVVMAREDTRGDKRLVGYVVPQRQPGPSATELKTYLKGKLPEYMVPSVFVFLDKMPLTSNGKADRRALPAPDLSRPELEREYVPPRTPVEEVVAGIWAELLRLEQVGIHDNFFELGGHSLLATQVVSRLRATFQVEIPLRTLFKHPTVAGLSEHIERARQTAQGIQAPPLTLADRRQALPLSFAQQRLWFFDQLEPGNLFYNLPNAIRLTGNMDLGALERAVREIVRRHESLRTTFASKNGQPYQVIDPNPTVTLPVIDINGAPECERETQAKELATQEARKSFDLGKGPLVRVTLLRLTPQEHVLLLTMHHVISDGWSMGGVFFRELAMLYRAFAAGEPSPLPELPIQYADFAVWQRHWLRGEVLDNQIGYWKKQLAHVPALELATDWPRPAEQRFHGDFQATSLPPELMEKLQALGQKEGATLFMVLLAGFKAMLSRYSGQDDVAVGTPIAGRNHAEIEGLIGFFVNTLVLRTDLSGDPTFRELLGRVRDTCLGAYDHQDVPFEKLVEELQPRRDMSRSPLFQVMFVLQNAPKTSMQLGDLTISRQEADKNVTSRYDLTLSVTESKRGLGVVVKYKTDLFDAATMKRFLEHYRTLLEGAVAHPEKPLSALTLLDESERRQVLVEWNRTEADYPLDRCVHQLIEAHALQTPDAVALAFQGQTLTYRELDRRANRLANYLRGLGVGLEDRVGLCLDRSFEMIVGMLGVHKAGAAYVPLDAAQPPERLEFILRDAEVKMLLTDQRAGGVNPPVRQGVDTPRSPGLVYLDTDWPAIAQQSDQAPTSRAGPDNLAYVIFTSGSTGQPKGVLVEHRGLTNVVCDHIRQMGIGPDTRTLQFVFPHFDAAQGEIYRILCAGATLCLAPAETLLPGPGFAELLRDQHITLASIPPAFLAAQPGADQLPALRTLVVGGEAILPEVAARWGKGRRLFNGYGPTETTIGSTLATDWDLNRPPPLGRPIANTQVYVLDSRMQPAPVGVPGELYIGGAGVARGYLHQPELTAARFIANPFSARPGARLYRTGDRVRWLFDGALEFLGRVDEQIKIRGFRIEPGEIEVVLGQHPAIRDHTVVAREDTPGDKRLVAYVVAQPPAPSASELRSYLKEKLPEYMVPSAFVFLDVLPRKAHGKVDRRALPAPEKSRAGADTAFRPPRDDIERQLVQLWEQSLGIDQVGLDDNFFELGGHSLLAVQLIEQIKEQFGQKLPVATLFRHPTLEDLAAVLRQKGTTAADSPLVAIQPHGSQPPLFVVHPAEGNVLCYADLARKLGTDQPLYGFQARGLDGEQPPHPRIEEMAADYVQLMRGVQPRGPYLLGGWSTGGLIALEMAQQLLAQGESVALLALLDTHLPSAEKKPPKIDPARRMLEFAQEKGLDLGPDDFLKLRPEEQLTRFLEKARAANVFPPGLGEEQIHRLQRRSSRTFQAQVEAVQQYVARNYPERITLFRCSETQRQDADDQGPKLGWDRLAADVELYMVPGTHETMIREPQVNVLAEQLRACLSRFAASRGRARTSGSPAARG